MLSCGPPSRYIADVIKYSVTSEDVQSNKGGGLPKIKILRPLILNPFLPVLLKLDETVNPKTRKQFLR